MAPDKKNSAEIFAKESFLFKHCKKKIEIPATYTSLHSCQRSLGIKYTVSNC